MDFEHVFDNLEQETKINTFSLDTEWQEQPQRYLKYAMAAAHYQKILFQLNEELKVVEANLRADAAQNPDVCLGQGVKPTVDRCDGYAITHPDRVALKEKCIQSKFNYDMAQAAVFTMQQRKDALENLVRLQGMEVYSQPKSDIEKDKETIREQVQSRMKKKRVL